MLTLDIPAREFWDPKNEVFVNIKGCKLQLEHSLVSVSKWEAKWCIPFISESDNKKLSGEKLIDYIKCMTITQNVDDNVYKALTNKDLQAIQSYIESPKTATTFSEPKGQEGKGRKKEVITSELIYYWMVANQIPFECQRWFLNRLLVLIRICAIKNNSQTNKKKMSKSDLLRRNASLNSIRRQQHNTRG